MIFFGMRNPNDATTPKSKLGSLLLKAKFKKIEMNNRVENRNEH